MIKTVKTHVWAKTLIVAVLGAALAAAIPESNVGIIMIGTLLGAAIGNSL